MSQTTKVALSGKSVDTEQTRTVVHANPPQRVSDMCENDLVPEMVFEDAPHHSGEAWNIGNSKGVSYNCSRPKKEKAMNPYWTIGCWRINGLPLQ